MTDIIVNSSIQVPANLQQQYDKALHHLKNGKHSHGLNLETLHLKELYSVRLQKKARLLLTSVKTPSGFAWVILDLISDHKYENSKFLDKSILKQFLKNFQKHFEFDLQEEKKTIPASQPQPQPQPEYLPTSEIKFYNEKWIALDANQKKIVHASLPLIVSGGPGSGKSCIGMSLLEQFSENGRKTLYVSQSPHLVQRMKSLWEQLPVTSENVEFKTYQDLISTYSNKTIVHDKHLKNWLKDYIRTQHNLNKHSSKSSFDKRLTRDLDALIQEFRIISECDAPTDWKTYQNLGGRQSFFSEESHKKWLFDCYWAYQKTLVMEECLHPAFAKVTWRHTYSEVIIDEAQDLSKRQLLNLFKLSKELSVAFLVDTNQSLTDGLSIIPYLLKLIGGKKEKLHTLSTTYRCPKQVIAAANVLLDLKLSVIGGALDKVTARTIKCDAPEEGRVVWIESLKKIEKHQALIGEKDTDFAVVTRPDLIEEARKRFNTSLVFTPEQIKGLEYKTIAAYQLFNEKNLKKITSNAHSSSKGRVKRNQLEQQNLSHGIDLNQIFTSFTRATEELFIIQKTTTPVMKHLASDIRHATNTPVESVLINEEPSAKKQSLQSFAEKKKQWELEARRQENIGNKEIADRIRIEQQLEKNAADKESAVTSPPFVAPAPSAKKTPSETKKPLARSHPVTEPAKITAMDAAFFLKSQFKEAAKQVKKILQNISEMTDEQLGLYVQTNKYSPEFKHIIFSRQIFPELLKKTAVMRKYFFGRGLDNPKDAIFNLILDEESSRKEFIAMLKACKKEQIKAFSKLWLSNQHTLSDEEKYLLSKQVSNATFDSLFAFIFQLDWTIANSFCADVLFHSKASPFHALLLKEENLVCLSIILHRKPELKQYVTRMLCTVCETTQIMPLYHLSTSPHILLSIIPKPDETTSFSWIKAMSAEALFFTYTLSKDTTPPMVIDHLLITSKGQEALRRLLLLNPRLLYETQSNELFVLKFLLCSEKGQDFLLTLLNENESLLRQIPEEILENTWFAATLMELHYKERDSKLLNKLIEVEVKMAQLLNKKRPIVIDNPRSRSTENAGKTTLHTSSGTQTARPRGSFFSSHQPSLKKDTEPHKLLSQQIGMPPKT